MVDNEASDHYSNDAAIRDLKYRLQDYVYLATPRKIFTAARALLDFTAAGLLHSFVINAYGNEILVRVDIVVVHGVGRNLFPVMTAAEKRLRLQNSQTGGNQRYRAAMEVRAVSSLCTFARNRITSGTFARSSRWAFVRGTIPAEWRKGERPPKQGDFRSPPCRLK